jgi:S-(hydroxymethyl)glutathione dehydrogenase/alcohol dehydrogenase
MVTFDGPLQAGQVLVKLAYSGICGKQLDEIDERSGPDPWLPHMLGHEGSGRVVACGSGVTKVQPGDHAVLHWLASSGLAADTPLYHQDGTRINAGAITTFNEYAVVPENRLTRIDARSDLRAACLFGCVATTGTGAVFNDAALRPGQSLAVFGCGGVGLCVIMAGVAAGANPIIAVDTRDEALQAARKFGAHHAIDATSREFPDAIRALTANRGVDCAIVTAASATALQAASDVAAAPSRVIMVGVPPPGDSVRVSALDVHRGKTLTGSYGGGTCPDRHIPEYLELQRTGRIDYSALIAKLIPLDAINEGIKAVRNSLAGRCVIDFESDRP